MPSPTLSLWVARDTIFEAGIGVYLSETDKLIKESCCLPACVKLAKSGLCPASVKTASLLSLAVESNSAIVQSKAITRCPKRPDIVCLHVWPLLKSELKILEIIFADIQAMSTYLQPQFYPKKLWPTRNCFNGSIVSISRFRLLAQRLNGSMSSHDELFHQFWVLFGWQGFIIGVKSRFCVLKIGDRA